MDTPPPNQKAAAFKATFTPVQVCLHCTVYFIILFRVRFQCTG